MMVTLIVINAALAQQLHKKEIQCWGQWCTAIFTTRGAGVIMSFLRIAYIHYSRYE